MALMIPMLMLTVLDAVGCVCSLYLFVQWMMHIKHKQSHTGWSNGWGIGCVALVIGLVIVLGVTSLPYVERNSPFADTLGFVSAVLIYGGPLLWIRAHVLFRRAKAQDSVALPRYDEPQEGVWPPPPTNTPRP